MVEMAVLLMDCSFQTSRTSELACCLSPKKYHWEPEGWA